MKLILFEILGCQKKDVLSSCPTMKAHRGALKTLNNVITFGGTALPQIDAKRVKLKRKDGVHTDEFISKI